MAQENFSEKHDDFTRQLASLRMRIDWLPPDRQSGLYEFAEAVEQQHRRLLDRRTHSQSAERGASNAECSR